MVAGALGGTGAHVQSLAAKEHKIDIASATVLRRPVVATCAWDRQTNLYLVTKATVQLTAAGQRGARGKHAPLHVGTGYSSGLECVKVPRRVMAATRVKEILLK